MAEDLVMYLIVACVLAIILVLSLNRRHREILVARLQINVRRVSTSSTPPRPATPEKPLVPTNPADADYKDVFPPSRRASLAKISTSLPLAEKIDLVASPASSNPLRRPSIPLSTPLEDLVSPTFTPTEISTADIEALGDFPDYAELSGVPLPAPYVEFDITKAIARPYRPLRWSYHQTMSLTKLEPDWWLELQKDYASTIKLRQELFRKHGKTVLDYLPGSELACKELMEMCLQFLCARYPQYFSLSEDKTTFCNRILENETKIKDSHPLKVLLDNVPEDFAIMLRNPDNGFYYFRAGVICSSLGWNVGTKIGMQLSEIHEPIPDYKEKMQFSMDRYFSRLPTDRPIQRGSWGLEIDQPLFMPPGDPHEAHRERQMPDLPLSRCHLRVDWQTLRRLPLSGAIVFNFKALFTPVEKFRYEPYIPALCARILRDGKRSLMQYKNTWHVEHVVVPALDEWAREQEEKGWTEKDWDVHTLKESPYYPGWEEMWHAEQGF